MPSQARRRGAPGQTAAERPESADLLRTGPVVPSQRLSAALDQVVAESVRRVATAASPPPPPATVSNRWLAGALGSWAVLAVLALLPPAFARGPQDQPWQPTPGTIHASLRYGLWLAHDRVEAFARARGRLPTSLEEVGVRDPSLSIRMEDARRYVLEGREGGVVLSLMRGEDPDAFLGRSLETLTPE